MRILPTPLQGLFEIHTSAIGDARGRFTRIFCDRELAPIRPDLHFTQVNLSDTHELGSIRGMHYQTAPAAEAKLIRCLRGRVFDVAVDLRPHSPSYLRWHGVELSDRGDTEIFIPEGFAHGFQALTDDVQLLYFHTAPWTPANEAGIRFDDPRVGISWPLPAGRISDKDRSYASIGEHFPGVQP